jgi:hypothetical protein
MLFVQLNGLIICHHDIENFIILEHTPFEIFGYMNLCFFLQNYGDAWLVLDDVRVRTLEKAFKLRQDDVLVNLDDVFLRNVWRRVNVVNQAGKRPLCHLQSFEMTVPKVFAQGRQTLVVAQSCLEKTSIKSLKD